MRPLSVRGWWEAALVAAVAGGVYLATMAPTIEWRNGGDDGAELTAAAYVWGVAHPPGYPLYLTLVRLAQYLPLGEPARAAALFSGLCAVLATVGVYGLTRTVLGRRGDWTVHADRVGACFAALAFALGPLEWSQAVVAEVYTLEAALLAWSLLALARWLEASREELHARSLWLALGLTLLASHHPPLGALFLPVAWLGWRRGLARRTWLQAGLLVLIGPLLLLSLWLRASFQPSMDWGDPTTLGRWWQQVTAAAYQGYLLLVPLADEIKRGPVAVSLLIRQGGWTTLALAALGLTWLWQERRTLSAILLGVSAYAFVFTLLYNARDGQVYLIPITLVLATAAGVGVSWVLTEAADWGRWRLATLGVTGVLVGTLGWQMWSAWAEVDVAGNTGARDWAVSTLQAAPPASELRSADDATTFPLWYAQHALRIRPDVAIVDQRLLPLDWYQRQLARLYPFLNAPGGPAVTDVPVPPEANQ